MSSFATTIVVPKVTVFPSIIDGSITSALLMTSSNSPTRPSTKLCLSLAAWYSAFSDKSPCSLASDIALMICGRSTVFNCFNSSCNWSRLSLLMGIFCIAMWCPDQTLRKHIVTLKTNHSSKIAMVIRLKGLYL